jgi:hypothetical protein
VRDTLDNLVDVLEALIDAFEGSALDYALGGAVAYSTWGEPRATRDIDLNVWVQDEELEDLFALLESLGATVDREVAAAEVRERGMFITRLRGYRIDIFTPSVPFYDEALDRRRRTRLLDRDAWVLSPETLAVFKMLFFRPKDLADVGRMMEIQGETFDVGFVRHWLVKMVGDSDERIVAWDRLAEALS